ncbi:hypothetical protein ACKFRM_06685 [Corynebacterium sp. YSMAA1_1_D6]|uniref:hypothetical protein n=1 Tax=unclassified Corynebacterium TaxID=2624378 RepID=UPI0038D14DD0
MTNPYTLEPTPTPYPIETTTNQQDIQPAAMTPVNTNVLEQLQAQAQSWVAASQIAEQLAKTDFAGPFKGKPNDMAAAILKGATLGIPPESIGKSIYVVHGTPSLYGKAALAIALQHGYIAETIEDTPTAVTVRMTSPKGQEMEVRYTIERATKEGLVKGNKAQYETRPSKMLYWKCIGELTDRMIPHLTGGMPIKEDWEQSPVRMTATREDVRAKAETAPVPALTKKEPEVVDEDDDAQLIELVQQTLAEATTPDDVTVFAGKLKESGEVPSKVMQMVNARWAELEGEK